MATDSNNKDRFSARGSRRELEKRDRFRKLLIAVNIILVLILFPAAVWGKQALAAGEELMPASAYYDAGGHGEYDDQLNGEASSPERGSAAAGQVPTGTAPATSGQVPTGTAPATAGQVPTGTAPATSGQVPTGTAPATAGQVLTEAGQISTTTGQAPAASGLTDKAVEAAGQPETPGVQGEGDSTVQANKAAARQMEIRRAGKAFMPDITILLIFASMFIIFACAVIVRTEFERGKKRRRKRA